MKISSKFSVQTAPVRSDGVSWYLASKAKGMQSGKEPRRALRSRDPLYFMPMGDPMWGRASETALNGNFGGSITII